MFQHVVFTIMYLINVMIPDIPSNIRLAQRRVSISDKKRLYQIVDLLFERNRKEGKKDSDFSRNAIK